VEKRLRAEGVLDDAKVAEIEAGADRQVEEAVAFADASPEPSAEELFTDIYAGLPVDAHRA